MSELAAACTENSLYSSCAELEKLSAWGCPWGQSPCTGEALAVLMSLRFLFPSTPQFLCNAFHTRVVFPEENLRWQQHHSFCNWSWSSLTPFLCHQSSELVNTGPLCLTTLLANHQPIKEWKSSFLDDLVLCLSHLEVLLYPCFIYSCRLCVFLYIHVRWMHIILLALDGMGATYFGLIMCLSWNKPLRALSERFCVSFRLNGCPLSDLLYVIIWDWTGGSNLFKGWLKGQQGIQKGGI